MRYIFTLILIATALCKTAFAQATFQSAATGNWDSPASWMLVSGTTSTNYPVSGDDATITSAHIITVNVNSQCNQLTINAAAQLLLNTTTSLLTVAGGITQSAASRITITSGALTVIGIMLVNPPTTTGTTLIDVQGGIFSCAGGMSITGTTVTRTSELRIGSGFANVVGGLATFTANAKINFTGDGTLTLAGLVSMTSTASFIPGIGRVIYVGIPGSNQTIAPLPYYRLVVTGFGGGVKQISGAVSVTDSLVLLTDTVQLNGGSLTLSNGVTVVRTAGVLLSPPVFSGVVDMVYNDVTKDTTGAEMPVATGVLRNLVINDIAGIVLGNNITVNNKLTLQNGALNTSLFTLNIANTAGGAVTDPAIDRNNGYVIGIINRSIGTSTGIRSFPLGIASMQKYRECQVNYTIAPTIAGTLRVQHFDVAAPTQSGLPLVDAGVNIINVANMYWQADALAGLSGGTYDISLTAEGIPGVTDLNTLRIIKRPSTGGPWVLNGIAGVNTGTITDPIVLRTGLTGFSQFAIAGNGANPLPISLLYFSGTVNNKKALLQWATATELNNNHFELERCSDGVNFSIIGNITAAGNSTQTVNYGFTDNAMLTGINYYRLKQVDVDGHYSYSKTVTLSADDFNRLKVYPTITKTKINIENISTDKMQLFTVDGRFIKQINIGANDVSNLPTGLYYVVDEKETVRFIKQ